MATAWQIAASATTDEALRALASLHADPEYSDLIIKCGTSQFKVHKAVVCRRSDFFRAACRKGAFKEGTTDVIELKAIDPRKTDREVGRDDPAAISHMIQYFYYNDYQTESALKVESLHGRGFNRLPSQGLRDWVYTEDVDLSLHANIYAAATKYDVPGLASLARFYFARRLHALSNLPTIGPEVAKAICIVLDLTRDDLRELAQLMFDYLLRPSSKVLIFTEVQEALNSIDGLALQMARQSRDREIKLDAQSVCGNHLISKCKDCGAEAILCVGCIDQGMEASACRVCGGNLMSGEPWGSDESDSE